MGQFILLSFWIFALWLIRRDMGRRDGLSSAIWIPTLWAFVVLSKPMSAWLGVGGGTNSLDGSPIDRFFFLTLIIGAIVVLVRRNLNWSQVIAKNWPIFLFYGFFLVSVTWAYSSESAFKRWFKDIGNVFIALVILTERNPLQAIRAVFWRCAIILVPLSFIYIRWFPNLGRRYSPHSGGLEVIGATNQKNELGPLIIVCGLVLIWDWIESRKSLDVTRKKLDHYLTGILLVSALYLLYLSDSKTSILCVFIGTIVLFSPRIAFLRGRVSALGKYFFVGGLAFYLLDESLGITEFIVSSMGRDMTFTGRTNVWRELLDLNTNPVIGVGFCSFWSDPRYTSLLPYWVSSSAHNGYLEMYLDGGWLGVSVLALLVTVTAVRVNSALKDNSHYSLLRFAIFIATVIGCLSESHFGRMSPLWFIFLLIAIEPSSLQRGAPIRRFDSEGQFPEITHLRSQ